MTAFEGSQTSSEYLQKRVVTEIIPLLPKPEDDVGSMCVCVCMSGCVVHVCTYMYNIYLQYILYISISYFCGVLPRRPATVHM